MPKARTPAEILKEARIRKGLTQAEVAKLAGLGANTYPKIERGLNQPSPSSIKKLIRVLDINPVDIPNLLS